MVDYTALPQPFSRAEARSVGISARTVERAAARALLERLAPGLYAVRAPWRQQPPWVRHEQLIRAAARLTPDAIVSHLSGAVLLGLPHPAYEPKKVTMTLLDDTRTSREDSWRQFHRGSTPADHVIIKEGQPYLTAARTVVDCCRELHPRDALAVTDAALRSGLVTRTELNDMRHHQARWPRIRGADLVAPIASPLRENWLESVSAWALHSHALPVGVPQVWVSDASGRPIGRVDAIWPELGVVGEADGRAKYFDTWGRHANVDESTTVATNLLAERVRENRLRDTGLEVFRWNADDAREGTPIVERFLAASDRADPTKVRAILRCSCCRRLLTDCPGATQNRSLTA